MLHDPLIAIVRTVVPGVVGVGVSWLVANGIALDAEAETALTTAVIGLVIGGYYALVTLLERKVHPAFGWLLGIAKAPAYSHKAPPAPAPSVTDTPRVP